MMTLRRIVACVFIYALLFIAMPLIVDQLVPQINLEQWASAQSGRVFYIDSVAGSNTNNGTSTATPWKSHPFMPSASGCTGSGSAPAYTHQAGDKFVFKGGSNWGAACFDLVLAAGGSSTAQDYYGVCLSTDTDSPCFGGTSWPSASWTRPTFNLGGSQPGNEPTGGAVLIYNPGANLATAGTYQYITFDNFEISNWDTGVNGYVENGAAFALGGLYSSGAATGTIVENSYIHDWISNTNNLTGSGGIQWVGYAVVNGAATLRNSVISDVNGHYVLNGITYNHSFMGGCEGCGTVSGNVIHDGWECTSRSFSVHDNECYNIQQGAEIPFSGAWSIHSHVIYDDGAFQNAVYAYNNYIHNNVAGLNVYMFYHSYIFNNVMWGNGNGAGIRLAQCASGQGTAPCGDSSSAVGWVANNTVDMTGGNGSCFQWETVGPGGSGLGTMNFYNNICIGTVGSFNVATINQAHNYQMSTSEASQYGYTAPNKYSPSSVDPNTSAVGTNLTTSCTGNLAPMCQDTSGAPWFGGSYKTRPTGSTGWDLGAYQGQGGTPVGPPTSTITAPSNNATISGASVTLTMTCVPQGSATISTMQFRVDGITFGATGSSSPYSITLDSTKTANINHTIAGSCTDSNSQTGNATSVLVTVNNSIPGCFISSPTGIQSLAFTSQSAPFTWSATLTPNSGVTNDTVMSFSNGVATGYGSSSVSLRTNASGNFDSYDGATGTYHASNTVAFVAGTAYSLSGSVLAGFNTFNLSVGGTAVASGWTFRATNTSLDHVNLISDAGVYDTVKVCNLQIGSATTITPSPTQLNFGNVTTSGNSTLNVNLSASGGTVTFTSKTVTGNATFTLGTDSCGASTATNCNVAVQFAPVSVGAVTGTLNINCSATGCAPLAIPLSGTGVASTATVTVCIASVCSPNPLTMNFNGVRIHTGQVQGPINITVVNGPATSATFTITGTDVNDFQIAQNGCISSMVTCSMIMQFSPTRNGNESANLHIAWTGGSQDVALNGNSQYADRPPF
jgi:hypothetical protein